MRHLRHSFCILHCAFCIALVALSASSARLPYGYKLLEYVETDGYGATAGPWVRLDYTPTSSSVIEANVKFLGTGNNQGVFCARGSQTDERTFTLFYISGSGLRWDYNAIGSPVALSNATTMDHVIRCSSWGMSVDGTQKVTTSPATYTPANKMILFASYTCNTTATPSATGNYAKMRLYSFKAWDEGGNTLRVDLIPCKDGNDVVSLYDAVSGMTYHSNNGNKPLLAGPTIEGLEVAGVPVECGEPDPGYGHHNDLPAIVPASAQAAWTNVAGTVAAACTGWELYDNDGAELDSGATTSFNLALPANDYRLLKWQWNVEYKATASATAGDGSAAVSGTWIPRGATATFTATPAADRTFLLWTDGAAVVSRDNPYSTTLMQPLSLRAVFTDTSSRAWRYDTSAKTLTEQGVGAGETAWVLNCTVSGGKITIASVKTAGTSTDLNFRSAVTATDGGDYIIGAIGNDTFKNRAAITSVALPDTLTSIGYGAFAVCTSMTNVVLSSTLKRIENKGGGDWPGAFHGCTALTTVTPFLPDSLEYLGWAAFYGCTNLKMDLRLGCGGGPFTLARYGDAASHFGESGITSVTMGDGVTEIGARDFYQCTSLTNVVLSPFLTKIGQRTDGVDSGAFQYCTALKTVTPFLPDTLTYLGWATFNSCTSLEGDLRVGCGGGPFTFARYGEAASQFSLTRITSVTMGDGVTEIGSRVFYGCPALTNVVLSPFLKTFGNRDHAEAGTFQNCTALRTVTPFLPDSLTSIGWGTFWGCTSLEGDLRVGCGTNALTLATRASNGGARHFSETAIGSVTIGEGLTSIPGNVFYDCASLTGIVIEAESPTFANGVFQNTKKVREVVFSGFPTWTSTTFGGWTNYQSRFTVPGISAPWLAFIADTAKTKPWSEIEGTAEADAYYAGFGAGAPQPRGYTVSGPAKQWIVTTSMDAQRHILQITGAPDDFGAPAPAYGEYDFTEEVAQGGVSCDAPRYAVSGDDLWECTGYTLSTYDDVNMEWINPVSGVGTNVLFHPSRSGTRQLKWSFATAGHRVSFDKPAAVSVTADTPCLAFDGFYPVGEQVSFSASSPSGTFVRWFGDVPAGTESNATVTVAMDAPKTLIPYFNLGWIYDPSASTISDGYWTLRVTVSGTEMTITRVTVRGPLPLLDLAKPVEGGAYTIVAISGAVFVGDTLLEELVLPETIREIRRSDNGGTFQGCTNLRTVTPFLPDSLTHLGCATFFSCTNLQGALRIGFGGHALALDADSTGASSQFAFTKISSVTLGDGVTEFGARTFFSCTELTNVVLSSTLRKIGQRDNNDSGAFQYCTKLRTVTPFLPDSLTYLGWATFFGCTSLEGDLRLGCGGGPFTLAQYGASATHFGETKITSVTMGDGVTVIGSRTFFGCTALTNVVLSPFLKTIGNRQMQDAGAFQNCTALKTVTPFLPDTLTSLGWGTFWGCTSLEGDLRLGCGTNALTLAVWESGNAGRHFSQTAIRSATIGAHVANLANNTFNGCPVLADVYFHDRPEVSASAFASIANYQARFFVPREHADWDAYLSDGANVAPWGNLTQGVRDEYAARFPSRRRPVGLGLAAPYANQWLMRWSPHATGTVIMLR